MRIQVRKAPLVTLSISYKETKRGGSLYETVLSEIPYHKRFDTLKYFPNLRNGRTRRAKPEISQPYTSNDDDPVHKKYIPDKQYSINQLIV